jgi:S-DNA-T family DNA segregation ATPase FtsK/SpoIIIE
VKVAVLTGEQTASLVTYPLLLPDDTTSADVDKVLPEAKGRLRLSGLRGVWRADGLYGLEVARSERATIALSDVKPTEGAALPWLLGVSTSGKVLTVDLARAPHVLIAGETGSGKSNHVSGALAKLVSVKGPDDVRLCLLDPKQVDLLSFADVPHTLTHITNPKSFADTLTALCDEMQRRYGLFKRAKARDLDTYNATGERLPRIVCVFDESAAAISANPKELEQPVLQLLQMGRAAGIHLVLAMQRPNGSVLSPTARLNLPLRIAFRMLDGASSRLVIDSPDATNLLGNGDGLLLGKDHALTRFQSPLASDKDLARATEAARAYPTPAFSLGGLTSDASTFTLDPALSSFENAVMLLEHFDDIRSSDLIKAGIVGSSTPAKALLSDLRAAGYVGDYDPSAKASKVLTSPDFGTYPRDGEGGSSRVHVPLKNASSTQKDGLDGLNGLRLRAVN